MFGLTRKNSGNAHVDVKSVKHIKREALSARRMIGFEAMRPDGVAYVGSGRWSVCVRLGDVNYVLAPLEEQKRLVDSWMKTLNMFDEDTHVQVIVNTRVVDVQDMVADLRMSDRGDPLDAYRQSFNGLITQKLAGMSSSTVTDKYMVVSLVEDTEEQAVLRLNQVLAQLSVQLRQMSGCTLTRLNRTEYLRLMHTLLQPSEEFLFNEGLYRDAPKNMVSKDFVCPWSMDFTDPSRVVLFSEKDTVQAHLWLEKWPAQLTDTLIAELAKINANITVSIHIQPWDRNESIEQVERRQSGVKQEYDRTVQLLARQGLGAESVPDSITERVDEVTGLLHQIKESNQRILDTLVLVSLSADTADELDLVVKEVKSVARKLSCGLTVTKFMVPQALNTMLPVAHNVLPMRRALTTDTASILIPFTSREITETSGLFYGVNAQSRNPILVDRSSHMNSNGFILGVTGSGKSQSAKAEITQRLLDSQDRILIIDPEHEYTVLAGQLGGSIITVSADSREHINPLDIRFHVDETDPVKSKVSTVVALLGALLGGVSGLSALRKSMIDSAAMSMYREYKNKVESGCEVAQPTLMDLSVWIKRLYVDVPNPSVDAVNLITELDMYTKGSSSGFSQQTNVDLSNRFIVFDTSALTGEVQTFGMMVILDQVWSMVRSNRDSGNRTWLYVDEFHRFFSNKYSISTFSDIYKRARKYGLGVTGITQNIDELLANDQARNMLSNADFLLLMNQDATDARMFQDLLALSDGQMQDIVNVQPGHGLLYTHGVALGVDNTMDTGNPLYRLYSTKFDEQYPVLSSAAVVERV